MDDKVGPNKVPLTGVAITSFRLNVLLKNLRRAAGLAGLRLRRRVDDLKALAGEGVTASAEDVKVNSGNWSWLRETGRPAGRSIPERRIGLRVAETQGGLISLCVSFSQSLARNSTFRMSSKQEGKADDELTLMQSRHVPSSQQGPASFRVPW